MSWGKTTMELTTATARPQRADARRNRERVLAAAGEAFAEYGRDAQMDDVARRAGVGVGTVYRHFPDKAALMEALLAARFEQFVEIGRRELEHEDPWTGLWNWLFACGELQAADRGFCDCIGEGIAAPRRGALVVDTGLAELNAAAFARCQEAGVMRMDAEPDDIPLLMAGVAATARREADAMGGSWRRHLGISLDGLRAPGSGQLPD
ncbi:MAG TPA: helix-turn-helix domain-containing protein [Thermoleophilaceae bacterium]